MNWGRLGLGAATFGYSEMGGLRPAWNKVTGKDPFDMSSPGVNPANARFTDGQYLSGQYQQGAAMAADRQAPQAARTQLGSAAQLDASQQAQFRDQQMAQANRLGMIASGQQQGAGELAAQRQANRAIAQQQAMARMGRGQPGMQRAAARNAADLGTTAAGQSQIAALQDQQAANAQLGSVLAQGREADIGMAGQNAQLAQQRMLQQGSLDQQRLLANVDMELRSRGLNDQTRLAYLSQLAQMNQAEMAGRLGQEQVAMTQPSGAASFLQSAGPIIAAAAMSDKRAKKNIRDGGSDIDEMLGHLKAVSYEYRDDADRRYTGELGDGRRLAGFIAQDLERSKAGKAIVSKTPEGNKVVNVAGGMFAALAASARLHERLEKLEGKEAK